MLANVTPKIASTATCPPVMPKSLRLRGFFACMILPVSPHVFAPHLACKQYTHIGTVWDFILLAVVLQLRECSPQTTNRPAPVMGRASLVVVRWMALGARGFELPTPTELIYMDTA